ncbi:MAG: preprotein translocase subunit SecE [Lentisphaerae bacterium]|nr:preprotein translocase subunit SecE [Lentisphaerota bacterium]
MKNPINLIKKLYDDTVTELKKCTWPDRQELYGSTMVVVSSLILLSLFVFVADKVFLLAVNLITGMAG